MNLTLEKIQQRLMSSDDLKTPLYIADKNDFKRNITDFVAAFRKYYPNYNIGYSFKTNYCKEFINVVKEIGGYAEVVSPKEYQLARNYGFDDSRIIYNGVIPDLGNKIRCANHGGIVNVDNVGELGSLIGIYTSPLAIGVRLNFDIGNGIVSRFGIDVDSKRNHRTTTKRIDKSQMCSLSYFLCSWTVVFQEACRNDGSICKRT